MATPGKSGPSKVFFLWFFELALLVGCVRLSGSVRFMHDPAGYLEFSNGLPWRAALFALVLCVSMTAFGLHHVYLRKNRFGFILRELYAFLFGGVALLVIYYLFPDAYIGRGVLIASLLLGFIGVLTLRMVWSTVYASPTLKHRVLVLGAGETASFLERRMRRANDRRNFRVIGYVPIADEEIKIDSSLLVRGEGGVDQVASLLDADEILVALEDAHHGIHMESLLAAIERGVRVCDLPTFVEREAGMITLSRLDPSWLVFSHGFDHSLPRRLNKRAFDVIFASLMLVLAMPLMLLTALAIRLESKGPILYQQMRVGFHGANFSVIKFRSMRVDAEKDGVAQWAKRDDDRVTRVGRFIRKTRLDELPQLVNVLRGEMSLVGPRPERPQFVDSLNEQVRYYSMRHSVLPGLTGWAQLRYPYGASVRDAEEKLRFDLFYVKNHTFFSDLSILVQTVEVVLMGKGAR
ncbi:TIGR03013 family XrtA/PEP-CTERM system glycosyltransferase [Solilutibacter silvestris]|uniref:Sugar transferase n=1 Tax=Solilutibacter silvestris TaxID=1645665 RepID=A0A2K1PZC2_9GAMM|nr:TIGR03013 family XrtA/PEP-CTERM system glycosyltransferase [Lysobacter silvestris]PNS08131.1 sugar transferase [Lysobacter silvestris]